MRIEKKIGMGERLKKFFNLEICVCAHLTQTRYAQKACAEMRGKMRKSIEEMCRLQATLKDIGIDVDINCTADNNSVVQEPSAWDVYAMANVQAPTGDPEYWFTVFATSDATKNQGAYKNEKLDQLEAQLSQEFDTDKRAELAVQMQQTVLDDNAFVYCSFLKMSQISRANVSGYLAHACDYYQVTADLDIN